MLSEELGLQELLKDRGTCSGSARQLVQPMWNYITAQNVVGVSS